MGSRCSAEDELEVATTVGLIEVRPDRGEARHESAPAALQRGYQQPSPRHLELAFRQRLHTAYAEASSLYNDCTNLQAAHRVDSLTSTIGWLCSTEAALFQRQQRDILSAYADQLGSEVPDLAAMLDGVSPALASILEALRQVFRASYLRHPMDRDEAAPPPGTSPYQ